jgi:hypothetical protein
MGRQLGVGTDQSKLWFLFLNIVRYKGGRLSVSEGSRPILLTRPTLWRYLLTL